MSDQGFKVHCQRTDLLAAIQAADGVVPSNSAKPILTHLLLSAGADGLEVTATDLQVGLRALVRRVEVDVAGQVVIPSRQLVGILKESRSPNVTFALEIEEDRTQLDIQLADGRYTVPAVIDETFPQVNPFPAEGVQVKVPVERFEDMIRKTHFAVDKERSSAVLSGVLLQAKGSEILMAATDGKVLGESVFPTDKDFGDDALQAIIPSASIGHLNRVLGAGSGGDVEISIHNKLIFVRCVGSVGDEEGASIQIELSSRLIDGAYPPYRNALPPKGAITASFRTSDLGSAVRRTALMTSNASRGIIMELTNGEATLVNLFNASGSATIPLACDYSGENQRYGLNAQYLGDVIKVIEGEEITLELNGPSKGIIIRDGTSTYLVMPITLPT